jgi:hypothetical protein
LWPAALRTRLSDISDTAADIEAWTGCRPDGGFVLQVAAVRDAELLTTASGFEPDRRPLPAAGVGAIEVVLQTPKAEPGTLQGMVVDPRGRPVAEARVGLGRELVRSDERGRFLLADDGNGDTLRAALPGYRSAVLERPATGFDAFPVLMLGADALVISGRVVDGDGAGVAGIRVWIRDPTLLSGSRDFVTAEGVSTDCASIAELRERHRRGEQVDPFSTPLSNWPWVVTGDDGAFSVQGLEDRPYTLRAMDPATVQSAERAAIAAGSTGVTLVLDQRERFATLPGRVVNRAGAGIANVHVRVQIDTQSLGGGTMHAQAQQEATTDADGRFTLRDVPHTFAYLRLDGDRILPVEHGRGVDAGLVSLMQGDELVVEANERLHVQVELADAARGDTVRVLDAAGERLTLNVFQGQSRRTTDELSLAEGRSAVFVVPDTAATIVLHKGDAEVARQALVLQPGDVNTIRM